MRQDAKPAARPLRLERAIFASGCFWGTEYVFKHCRGVFATAAEFPPPLLLRLAGVDDRQPEVSAATPSSRN